MKKIVVSAICGLCLFGAFACAAQPANATDNTVAISRYACFVR